MKSILISSIFSAVAALFLIPTYAQNTAPETESGRAYIDNLVEQLSKANPTDGREEDVIGENFEAACELIVDEKTQQVCWEIQREYLRYYKWGYEQRKDVILFQNLSTKLILLVVISLVLLGMYFAWYQFKIAMSAMKQRVDSGESPADPQQQEEVKISGSEIAARSSYMGVVILIVSLAFLYRYLVFVYPIEEIL